MGAKDAYFKRGYGFEKKLFDDTTVRIHDPEDLKAFEVDFNRGRKLLICETCGQEFYRKKGSKGKTPKFCPECRERRKKIASKKYFEQIKVSGKYTPDRAELLKMFYVMRSYDKKIQVIIKESLVLENRWRLKSIARILTVFLNRLEKYLGEEQEQLIK